MSKWTAICLVAVLVCVSVCTFSERYYRPVEIAPFTAMVRPAPEEPALPDAGLLCRYTFESNIVDMVSQQNTVDGMSLECTNGSLYLNGGYECSNLRETFRATVNVPKLDYRSLAVSLQFYPLAVRAREPIFMAGRSYRWFGVKVSESNTVAVSLNNGRQFFDLGINVPPRQWHHVACSLDLDSKVVRVVYDGELLPPVFLPDGFRLDVEDAQDKEDTRQITFTDYSCGEAFYGFVDNLRVYGKALNESDLLRLVERR